MAGDQLEEDPVAQPRCQGFLESDLTRLVGAWGRAAGTGAGTNVRTSVRGLAFLSSKPSLAIARLTQDGSAISGSIRFVSWEDGLETGECRLRDIPPHTPVPGCIGIDVGAGDRVLGAMTDRTIRLFDGTSGEELRRFEPGAEVVKWVGPRHFAAAVMGLSANFSPFSDAGSRREAARFSIHDLESGAKVAELDLAKDAWIAGIAVRADGDRIVLALDSTSSGALLKMIDARCSTVWETPVDSDFEGGAQTIALSADGTKIATCHGYTGMRLYDGVTGALLSEDNKDGSVTMPAFAHHGGRLTYRAGGRYVTIADAPGNVLHHVDDPFTELTAWSPDDRVLATGDHRGNVQLYDTATLVPRTARPIARGFGTDESRVALALAQTNEVVIADHAGTVRQRTTYEVTKDTRVLGMTSAGVVVAEFWNGPVVAIEGSKKTTLAERMKAGAFVSSGRLVLTGNDDAVVFDLGAGSRIELSGAHRDDFVSEGETEHHDVSAAAVSQDGLLAATGSSDSTVAIWSLPEGKLLHHIHVLRDGYVRMRAFALAFSRDASLLFAVVNGAGIYAYEVGSEKIRYTLAEKEFGAFAEVPPAAAADRRLVAFALPDGVLLCNPDDGHVLDRITLGDEATALAFSGGDLFVQTARRVLYRFALKDASL